MKNSVVGIFGCLLLATLCSSAHLPATFIKCKKGDDHCFGEAIKDALSKLTQDYPEAGLPSLAPLDVPSFIVSEGKEIVKVIQHHSNVQIYGLTTPDTVRAGLDLGTLKGFTEITVPRLDLVGQYKGKGTIFHKPVDGEGTFKVRFENLIIRVCNTFEKYEKEGGTHLNIIHSKTVLDPGFIQFDFENLIRGDAEASKKANAKLNEKWEAVFKDIKESYELAINSIATHQFNQVLARIPFDELFLK